MSRLLEREQLQRVKQLVLAANDADSGSDSSGDTSAVAVNNSSGDSSLGDQAA